MTQSAIVLIADDDPVALELLCERLRPDRYRLVTAVDGEDALTKARQLKPDIVILDVMMPKVDGFEACRRLRADPLLREVPILLLTALQDHASRMSGLEAGADDFVSKTHDASEFKARVRTITRLNRYRRLLDERAKFEWLIHQSDYGYLMLDDGDKILYANTRARKLLALGDERLPDKTFLGAANALYRCEPLGLWHDWPRPATTPLYLLQPESPTRGALWLRVDLLDLPSDDSVHLVRLRDQTRQMSLGRNFWQLRSLVADKLQTPLRMTLESLQMLVDDAETYSPEELSRLAALAQRSGERLRHQLQDILAHLGETDDRLHWQSGFPVVRFAELAAELASLMKLPAPELLYDDDVGGEIPLSPVEVEVVLREIFDNFRQLHPMSSPLLSIGLRRVDDGKRRRLMVVVTADTSSTRAAQMERFWIPYYQTDEDSPISPDTLGFGMSIVATLVWGIGGTCALRDRGDGTVELELVLPRLSGAAV